jgi:hypothetical protein
VGHAGATWDADGTIYFTHGTGGLFTVPARGGDPEVFLEPDRPVEQDLHQPHALPGGRGILFVAHRAQTAADSLYVVAGSERKLLLQIEGQLIEDVVYSPSGHILYRRSGTNTGIWALPFLLSSLEVIGEPFLVAPDAGAPSVSADGTLTYLQGLVTGEMQLVWVDRAGEVTEAVGQPQRNINYPAVSPDGNRAAVAAQEAEAWDIWIHDLRRGTKTRLTFTQPEPDEDMPAWSPDGRYVYYFYSRRNMVVRTAADGGGEPEEITPGREPALSPDGKTLLFENVGSQNSLDVFSFALGEESAEQRNLTNSEANEGVPDVSPDGKYVAFQSDGGGRQIYLIRFPSGEGRWQVSTRQGLWPRWDRRGGKLYYRDGQALMEVDVNTAGNSPAIGVPRKLFDPSGSGVLFHGPFRFDVSPDGQKFLLIRSVGSGPAGVISLNENWFVEFKDRN